MIISTVIMQWWFLYMHNLVMLLIHCTCKQEHIYYTITMIQEHTWPHFVCCQQKLCSGIDDNCIDADNNESV